MNTVIKKIDRNYIGQEDFLEAVNFLREGKLVAFPTETVYGLGGNALDKTAAKCIYEAKGRPSDNPLIVHIAELAALGKITKEIPEKALLLAQKFWPGPLTMIFKKSHILPDATTGGLDTVAVRMPSDEIARRLILESGCYIAAPSANLSGKPSTTRAEHVIEDLNGRVHMIIDGGASVIGLESTIVDVSGEEVIILRPGYITKRDIEEVIGPVAYDETLFCKDFGDSMVPKAPGMKYKHYAPKADLTIYEGIQEAVAGAINKESEKQEMAGKRIGIIATDETIHKYQHGILRSIGSRNDEISITSRLFDLLREFDSLEVDYIYTESFGELEHGLAVMNRLLKAAGYQVMKCEENF